MKKSLFFLLSIFLTSQLIAQNNLVLNDDCPPVPWVNAELLEDEKIYITWDAPCDTCQVTKYRLGGLDSNPCNASDTTGTFSPIASTLNHSYTLSYHHFYNAILVRAEYDYCVADGTRSNLIVYDSTWYNQTFQLTVTVSLEDGGNPEGANVKVDGANCYYESLLYENQTDSEGITLFEEVMHGTYNITVSKPGYHTAVVEDFYLNQDSTINVELKIFYVDIEENQESNSIKIFPNPATNQLNIQSEETIEEITLINHIGQTVLVQHINNKQFTINTSGLEEGIYIVMIKTDQGVLNKRIVIKN